VLAETKHVQSSQELFQDIVDTNNARASSICPRFRPAPPTDWPRIGYGGDGVYKNTGMYMDPVGQYTTSNDV
jgi:hypothetical protein